MSDATSYLLSSTENAKILSESIKQLREGKACSRNFDATDALESNRTTTVASVASVGDETFKPYKQEVDSLLESSSQTK
jgi:hypothetical protein